MLQRPPEDTDLKAIDDAKFVWGGLVVPLILVGCVAVVAFGIFSLLIGR
jgi:hypothetical protein